MSNAHPPAGWYSDPEDSTRRRYWDGNQWTEHRAPNVAPQAPLDAASGPTWQQPSSVVTPTGSRVGSGSDSKPWYRRGWAIALIAVLVIGVIGAALGEDGDGSAAAGETTSAGEPDAEPVMSDAEREAAEREAEEQAAEEAAEEAAAERRAEREEARERAAERREAARRAKAEEAAATQTFTGFGSKVLRIKKSRDAKVATITHQGGSNFVVWNVDNRGANMDLLVNEIGGYRGTRLFDAMQGETTAALKIEADGAWSVTIKPVHYARAWKSGKSIKGQGSEVLIVDEVFTGGLQTAKITHAGTSNFVVSSYGDSWDLLVNEIGRYAGEIMIPSGTVVLEVEADGAWNIKRTG